LVLRTTSLHIAVELRMGLWSCGIRVVHRRFGSNIVVACSSTWVCRSSLARQSLGSVWVCTTFVLVVELFPFVAQIHRYFG